MSSFSLLHLDIKFDSHSLISTGGFICQSNYENFVFLLSLTRADVDYDWYWQKSFISPSTDLWFECGCNTVNQEINYYTLLCSRRPEETNVNHLSHISLIEDHHEQIAIEGDNLFGSNSCAIASPEKALLQQERWNYWRIIHTQKGFLKEIYPAVRGSHPELPWIIIYCLALVCTK